METTFRIGVLAAASFLTMLLIAESVAQADSNDPDGRQGTCLPHDQVAERLGQRFQEKRVGSGVSGDGTLVEIYMSATRSFTVIKTNPSGVSCVVDYGIGWQPIVEMETASWMDGIQAVPDQAKN
jgi:hypothetical protein